MTDGILVVGSGFGGLAAIRALRKLDRKIPIRLLSPAPEFIYYPSMIWVPTGLRKGAALRVPLASFLARMRVQHVAGRVQAIEDAGRRVRTDTGVLSNDGLILATGAQPLRALPGIEHSYSICGDIGEAEALRARLRALARGRLNFGFAGNPLEPAAMRGGPVFELLFGVDTWLRRRGRRKDFDLSFFAPTKEPGKRLGDAAVLRLLQEMVRRGISTHLGHKLLRFEADAVVTEGGRIDSDLTVFLPGLRGPDWLASAPFALSPGGFVHADAGGRVEGHARVYVAGDIGHYPGPDWMPKQGHMAELQGRAAARNLLAELDGARGNAEAAAELMCIVDTLDGGIYISRTPKGGRLLASRAFHYAKRAFEQWYLWGLR